MIPEIHETLPGASQRGCSEWGASGLAPSFRQICRVMTEAVACAKDGKAKEVKIRQDK